MFKRISLAAVILVALAVLAASASAAKPKPVAYGYSQCATKSTCNYNVVTNPKGTQATLSFYDEKCGLLAAIISHVGTLKIKSGKFSTHQTASAPDSIDKQNHSMTITVTAKLKKLKKVSAKIAITTDSPSCTSLAGTQTLKLKYTGPIYGG
jgi:hypothetical protein